MQLHKDRDYLFHGTMYNAAWIAEKKLRNCEQSVTPAKSELNCVLKSV
jgi:hypothetical protein